ARSASSLSSGAGIWIAMTTSRGGDGVRCLLPAQQRGPGADLGEDWVAEDVSIRGGNKRGLLPHADPHLPQQHTGPCALLLLQPRLPAGVQTAGETPEHRGDGGHRGGRDLRLGLGTENRYQYGTGSNTTGTYPDQNATQISVLHFGALFLCLSQLNTVAREIPWGTCKTAPAPNVHFLLCRSHSLVFS